VLLCQIPEDVTASSVVDMQPVYNKQNVPGTCYKKRGGVDLRRRDGLRAKEPFFEPLVRRRMARDLLQRALRAVRQTDSCKQTLHDTLLNGL
jgi:hypothetical protein